MCGQDDGGVFFQIQFLDKVPYRQLGYGIQADGGLVQKKDPRIVEKRCGDLPAHPLSQGKLSYGCLQELCKIQHLRELFQIILIHSLRNQVNFLQQFKGIENRHVPPELGALSEDNSYIFHIFNSVFPWGKSVYKADAFLRGKNSA